MKKNIGYVLEFVIILGFWLLSGLLFRVDNYYYDLLDKPWFTLSGGIISIVWFIIYILITISIVIVINKQNIIRNNDYMYILLTNYLSNQLFMYFFFYLMSPLLGFIVTTITFVSSIFLYIETKKINRLSSLLLIPYVLYSSYAFVLSTSIYVMNF